MAMRLTGMMSGMDTESIIQDLVAVRKKKVDSVKKDQIRLNWQQDAWKGLNAKLKGLQTKYLNNMRFVSSYSKRATTVSNSSIVSVITGENAVNGVQSLQVKQLAKTGYLTGGKIEGKDGGKLTALSKMSDIMDITGEGTISLKSGSNTADIKITEDTTISDVLTQMKKAGLNASFDAKNQRFFVSAAKSGEASDFSITALDANGDAALSALGLKVNLNDDAATLAEYKKYAAYYVAGDRDATLANMQGMIDSDVDARTASYLEAYKGAKASLDTAQKRIAELNDKYKDSPLKTLEEYDADIKALQEKIDDPDVTEDDKKQFEEQMKTLQEQRADRTELDTKTATVDSLNKEIADIESYVNITSNTEADGTVTYSAAATDKLIGEVEDRYYNKAEYAAQVMASYNPDDTTSTGATKVKGQDAVILLNGAEFTNNDNVFEINGLTFTALSETKDGETVTITTQQDTDGIYDMVKNFLKEYNSIINEMDRMFNAESSKGYEPLTSEEKYEMSDKEVEEWEKKIKDSIFRRDENISSISSALREVMSGGTMVNGKKMYLSDFGIDTLGYFNAPDNEKHAYHIDGDPDDTNTSGEPDKLKGMISNDPDTVISFFSQLSKDLYAKMDSLSSAVQDQRSYGSFFDDKRMKAEHDEYSRKILDMEKKLTAYEDKWYRKFSAMETAMAKMQSNVSAITGLLGGQ